MKTVIRTSILCAAVLAVLATSSALAAGPMGGPRYPGARFAANPNAASRVTTRKTAEAVPAPAPDSVAPQAVEPGPMQYEGSFEGDPGMWEDYGDGGCCDDGCCDTGSCGTCRHGRWYFGIDYLLVRPRLSQGVAAYTQSETINEQGSSVTTSFIDSSTNYSFLYNSSFRLALGYRLLDCGGDIQFAYWRITGDDTVSVGPANPEANFNIYGQLGITAGDGDFLTASTGITANIYDLDFSKTLALGGPQGDCCDYGFCPRWDLRGSAGIRAADVTRFNNSLLTDFDGNTTEQGDIYATFAGAGPRVGMLGRRYFGECGMLSVYAKGSQALLIGNYKISRVRSNVEEPLDVTIDSQYDSFCRMIPVTDIEIGGTWQIADFAFVSIGWFFQCWWDLGQSETITSGPNFGPLDTANILSFDGLFVRGELFF